MIPRRQKVGEGKDPTHVVGEDAEPSRIKRQIASNWRTVLPLAILVVVGGAFAYWRIFIWQPADADPFTTQVTASAEFPLYYPLRLPSGYRIDTKSVTEPQQGIVVFYMIDSHGHKLYMSEEARPESFDLGGFYKKFQNLTEVPVSDGAVAVGRINGGKTEIASRANNKTWILSNTTAAIPLGQLMAMMKSLTLSY